MLLFVILQHWAMTNLPKRQISQTVFVGHWFSVYPGPRVKRERERGFNSLQQLFCSFSILNELGRKTIFASKHQQTNNAFWFVKLTKMKSRENKILTVHQSTRRKTMINSQPSTTNKYTKPERLKRVNELLLQSDR